MERDQLHDGSYFCGFFDGSGYQKYIYNLKFNYFQLFTNPIVTIINLSGGGLGKLRKFVEYAKFGPDTSFHVKVKIVITIK